MNWSDRTQMHWRNSAKNIRLEIKCLGLRIKNDIVVVDFVLFLAFVFDPVYTILLVALLVF